MSDVQQNAKAAAAQAQDQARDLARQARDQGAHLAGDMKDRVVSGAESRKNEAADRVELVAEAARHSAEQLEGHEAWLAGLVERGADELSGFAETLRTNDLRSLLGRLEAMAREQPALFAGASLAAGFALTRIARAAPSGHGATEPKP